MLARLRLYLAVALIVILLVTITGLFFRARRAERQLGAAAAEVATLTGKVAEAQRVRRIDAGETKNARRMVAAGARVVARVQAKISTEEIGAGQPAALQHEEPASVDDPIQHSAIAASDSHNRFHIRIPVTVSADCFRLTGEPTQWLIRQRFVVSNLWFAAGDRRFTGATITELAPDTGEALAVYEADAADIAAEYTQEAKIGGLRRFGWTAGVYAGWGGQVDAGVGVMWGIRF